jgi:uncharacterized protein DUF4157
MATLQDPQPRFDTHDRPASAPTHSRVLQRKCAGKAGGCTSCESCKDDDEALQRSPDGNGAAPHDRVPPSLHETLASPGHPLDGATREFMESRFGHDFSNVRVHADTKVRMSAASDRFDSECRARRHRRSADSSIRAEVGP